MFEQIEKDEFFPTSEESAAELLDIYLDDLKELLKYRVNSGYTNLAYIMEVGYGDQVTDVLLGFLKSRGYSCEVQDITANDCSLLLVRWD